MNDVTDDSWTTVTRNKKTNVPTGSGGYVPPHLRKKEVPVATPKVVDMNSAEDFPTLGGTNVKKATAWGSKASFSQKINDLIAFEQRTEAEKMEAQEIAKELEGYEVLSLKFDKERYIAFNQRMIDSGRDLERRMVAYDREMYAYVAPREDTDERVEEDSDYDE